MSNKAVFFDRDNTLIMPNANNYIYRVGDFYIPEAYPDALKKLYDHGFKLFVVTNQGRVAQGRAVARRDPDRLAEEPLRLRRLSGARETRPEVVQGDRIVGRASRLVAGGRGLERQRPRLGAVGGHRECQGLG